MRRRLLCPAHGQTIQGDLAMTQWVKCTFSDNDGRNGPGYVNLGIVSIIRWSEKYQCTFLTFPADDTLAKVLEKPEDLLKGH
jgi:hypothetical protein